MWTIPTTLLRFIRDSTESHISLAACLWKTYLLLGFGSTSFHPQGCCSMCIVWRRSLIVKYTVFHTTGQTLRTSGSPSHHFGTGLPFCLPTIVILLSCYFVLNQLSLWYFCTYAVYGHTGISAAMTTRGSIDVMGQTLSILSHDETKRDGNIPQLVLFSQVHVLYSRSL